MYKTDGAITGIDAVGGGKRSTALDLIKNYMPMAHQKPHVASNGGAGSKGPSIWTSPGSNTTGDVTIWTSPGSNTIGGVNI